MFFKQKKDLISAAKMFKGTLGVVSSPNSSAVYGCFILQRMQVLTHLTFSDCLKSLKRIIEGFMDHEGLRKCEEFF